jgi:hypothetical protein
MIRERGSVGLYLVFSLVIAGATGYGVYRVIHEHRTNDARAALAPTPAPRPAPPRVVDELPMEDIATDEPPVEDIPEEPVVDVAERDAIDPDGIDDSSKDAVAFGQPGISGALDRSVVEQTVKQLAPRFVRCARKAREQDNSEQTMLRFAFTVAATGKVEDASYRAVGDNELIAECALDVVRRSRFAASRDRGAVQVVYPILVAPANDSASATAAGCDEVACVLDNYEMPCCAPFRSR